MIIVTGGTGTVGRELVALLKMAGLPYKVVARDRNRARAVLGKETNCVTGDLYKPATLKAAFGGADRLFLMGPDSPKMDVHTAEAIRIARTAGVNHLILLSGPDILMTQDAKCEVGQQHWRCEQALLDSGIDYTIIRPHYFMQNVLNDSLDLLLNRQLFRAMIPGTAPVSMVDVRDVAAVAYCALTYSGHRGKTYSVMGEPASMNQMAETFSAIIGQRFEYEHMSGGRAVMSGNRANSRWYGQIQKDWGRVLARGGGDFTTGTIADVTGYAPRTVENFVQDHAHLFQQSGD